MKYRIKVPARINILGNPSDANEGDFATISAAIDLYAGAVLEPADNIILEMLEDENAAQAVTKIAHSTKEIPLPYDGQLDLLKGAINRLHQFSPEFREKLEHQGIRIAVWTKVPRQSGMGGSSLFVIATLVGLRTFYQLDPALHNDYVIAELTQRVEAKELNIACGFADRYVPLFGGLAYLDYRGKLHHKKIFEEPYVTYERLDPWMNNLTLVAICTGIQHDSGDVHRPMRTRYLEEHAAWSQRGGDPPPMVQFMSTAWETAWRGKIALVQNDMPTFGQLMIENHEAVNAMMTYCRFEGGAGWANNMLIETALENGALGAKLTGAGQGGSVFALVPPGEEEKFKGIWQAAAQAADLDRAFIYQPSITKLGATIEPGKST